MALEICITK